MQRFSFLRMMKKVNTLIVGLGLAGIAYAETLRKAGKQFHVIAEKQAGSSVIAAAVYNPTVLKRYTLSWKGLQFHQTALPFYQKLEKLLHTQLLFPYPIHKLFNKAGEHNLWSVAADSTGISNYLDPEIYQSNMTGVKSPFGYGKVLNCGRLDTSTLIHAYQTFLATDFEQTEFIYSQLNLSNDQVRYMDIEAEHVVFCEGFSMSLNPYFKSLPLVGSKGQILIIKAPLLSPSFILKGPIFLVPLGDDHWWAGASFEQEDKTLSPTFVGRNWLEEKIQQMIDVPYEIVDHITHIRPTVIDRRPILGTHSNYSCVHLLNGLGSRGVLTAPLAASWLFEHIEHEIKLLPEVDLIRFLK